MMRKAGGTGRILAAVRAARDVAGGTRHDLELYGFEGPYDAPPGRDSERIPGILMVPKSTPAPAALLLHGFGSRKERMADTIGEALLRHGVASLAVDLPLHGVRQDAAIDLRATNPLRLVSLWRDAVREAATAIAYLAARPDADGQRLGIVGYSLGSFLANIVASSIPDVRAVVLAAGGDLPDGLPFEPLVRGIVDPVRAVRGLEGRPLLMVNGRSDRTVKAAQAERLFAAAGQPKTMRWYAGGHWPPGAEVQAAAAWLAGQLQSTRTSMEAGRAAGRPSRVMGRGRTTPSSQ